MTKTFQDETLFGYSNFGFWDLFDIWNLIFDISISQFGDNRSVVIQAENFTIKMEQNGHETGAYRNHL